MSCCETEDKVFAGIDSANSLTRSLAASRSVATPSQRTLPPPCLLKMSNGGTIALPISRAPYVNYVCNQTHAEESCGCYESCYQVSPPGRRLGKEITPNQKRGRCKSLISKYTESTMLIPLSGANIKPRIVASLVDRDRQRGDSGRLLSDGPYLDLDRTPRE